MPRSAPQRDAVKAVFQEAGRPLSADEAHELAAQQLDGIGVATVYRAINHGVEKGWLVSVDLPGESATRYELADLGHHHHFECNQCRRVFDLHGCPGGFNDLMPEGFELKSHDLTLFGLCRECAA